jgi:hypothetical protein
MNRADDPDPKALLSRLAVVSKESVHADDPRMSRGSEARMTKPDPNKVPGTNVTQELETLRSMTTSALAEKFFELYGEPTRSRNKPYLQKRLAWRIQEIAEGGLSESALAKIAELGDKLPERWKRNLARTSARIAKAEDRDPRLPAVGTTLTRKYDGASHRVSVREDGFLYRGKEYQSLSAIARLITGTSWNGFLFFGLETRDRGAKK